VEFRFVAVVYDTGFSVWNDDAASSERRVVADFVARIDEDDVATISRQVLDDGGRRFTGGHEQLIPDCARCVEVSGVVVVVTQLTIANSHRPLAALPPSCVHRLFQYTGRLKARSQCSSRRSYHLI